MKLKGLIIGLGLSALVSLAFSETIKKFDRKYVAVGEAPYESKIYEEVYEGVKKFDARVGVGSQQLILIEDLVFFYDPPASNIVIGRMHLYRNKSIRIKIIPDNTEAIIPFKDIDKMDFFRKGPNSPKWWELKSLEVYLKNGKKITANILFGYRYAEVKGKVYNSALEKYLEFEEEIDGINSIDFIDK